MRDLKNSGCVFVYVFEASSRAKIHFKLRIISPSKDILVHPHVSSTSLLNYWLKMQV